MTILLQVVLPLALIAALAFLPPRSKVTYWIELYAIGFVILAAALAGLWLAVPWWVTNVYPIVFGVAAVFGARRSAWEPGLPRSVPGWIRAIFHTALGGFAASVMVGALLGRVAPGPAIELASPVGPGTWLVANGGSDPLVNSHRRALDPPAPGFACVRGLANGVDLVALDGLGLAARGSDRKDHAAFGREALAPCAGTVVATESSRADRPVGDPDPASVLGNYVWLRCAQADVVLSHLAQGSVAVQPGAKVLPGERVGAIGNSGASDAPHLQVHAQRPGKADAPLCEDPLPVSIGGRYLVRNDRYAP